MHKKSWIIGVCLVLLGLVAGWAAAAGGVFSNSGHIPPLKVAGDVNQVLNLQNMDNVGRTKKISFLGTGYQAVRLVDIVNKAEPAADIEQLYLVGLDGFTAAIPAADIDGCYITFTAENGWEAINLTHPNSSNVKSIAEILVVSGGSGEELACHIISPDADLNKVTPGQLLTGPLLLYPYAEGQAVVQKDGEEHEAQVFTRRRVFKVSDLIPLSDKDKLLVINERGDGRLVNGDGYFEVRDNQINYLQPDTRDQLEKIKGIILRPPVAGITDAYYDARHYLEGGRRTLVIVLEGLTYRQYCYAADRGYAPFLENSGQVMQACGVYPLGNNVGLAALLTGMMPGENGISAAGDQELKVPSIFTAASNLDKKAVFLDTGEKQLAAEMELVYIGDKNLDGSADDQLFEEILALLEQDYDLLVARFNGIEQAGKGYGPLAPETMARINATDRYLKEIVDLWPGPVIVIGTQSAGSGGSPQKSFNSESMFVPYWCLL
ncbi:MAG: hypothetical protein HQP61_07545 [Peptococcaceae bacterium]|nr:hypothetical protein [Candidatus Syntrophopropionicum ammoniitolerans]